MHLWQNGIDGIDACMVKNTRLRHRVDGCDYVPTCISVSYLSISCSYVGWLDTLRVDAVKALSKVV